MATRSTLSALAWEAGIATAPAMANAAMLERKRLRGERIELLGNLVGIENSIPVIGLSSNAGNDYTPKLESNWHANFILNKVTAYQLFYCLIFVFSDEKKIKIDAFCAAAVEPAFIAEILYALAE